MPEPDQLDLLTDLIAAARRAGADAADALAAESRSLSVARRLGKPERLERSEGRDIGLRVFVGRRQAIVSSTDRSPAALAELVGRAVAMARAAPEDEFSGLADSSMLAGTAPDCDLLDPVEPDAGQLLERARTAEEAALAVPGVTNSEGGEAGWGMSRVALAASNGFTGAYSRSSHSVSAVALAGSGTGMERDYDYSSVVHGSDLTPPDQVGRTAGERAVRRLGPRKAATAKVPVVFEQRLAGGLLRHLAGAINGVAIARGTSFLKDSLGKRILPPGTIVMDDPLRRRGLASRPFDAEGLATAPRAFIDDGVLTSWVLDLRSARQLGMSSTGHAVRGPSSPPGPSVSNLHLAPGARSVAELVADIREGLLVTELIGMGVNMITGDYSRGAAGFWIENGAVTYPVSEITIAGRLQDMFLNLCPGNDLVFRNAVNAPTIRIDGMTVAGR